MFRARWSVAALVSVVMQTAEMDFQGCGEVQSLSLGLHGLFGAAAVKMTALEFGIGDLV